MENSRRAAAGQIRKEKKKKEKVKPTLDTNKEKAGVKEGWAGRRGSDLVIICKSSCEKKEKRKG